MTKRRLPRPQVKISDRIPPDSDQLAVHDRTLGEVDYRQVLGRRGRKPDLSPRTQRLYQRWRDRYVDWCGSTCNKPRYQPDIHGLDDRKATEFVESLVTPQPAHGDRPARDRLPPNSVQQALTALRFWAHKLALDPQPSFNDAYAVLHRYLDELRNPEQPGGPVITSRSDRRILPQRAE